jgi:HAD superfamily hydrolase (TIGR01509 family)
MVSSPCSIEQAPVPPLPDRRHWRVQRTRANWRSAAVRGGGITTLVLDLGGVLAPTLFESVRLPGFPEGPTAPYHEVERGKASERAYWEDLGRTHGLDIRALWQQCTRLRPSMMRALSAVITRLPVVAFTNDMAHWFGDAWRARFPELERLDRIVEASKLGVLKPHADAFRRLLAVLQEPAERCLFVDDLDVNLVGAAQVGLRTFRFDVTQPEQSARGLLARLALPEPS